MNTDEKVDIFLEHFGKKGMKWGVRTSKTTSTEQTSTHVRNVKIAKIGLGVAAAGLLVYGSRKVLGVRKSTSTLTGAHHTARLIVENRNQTARLITESHNQTARLLATDHNQTARLIADSKNQTARLLRGR